MAQRVVSLPTGERHGVRERWALGGDRGSGSVLAIALVAAILVLAGLVLPLNAALTVRQHIANAADAAALAAADTASGLVVGDPCENAGQAARLHGAVVVECTLGGAGATTGLESTISVERTILGLPVRMSARAGPPARAGPTSAREDHVNEVVR